MSSITHTLKTAPVYYEAVLSGQKTFEVRLNDRDFKVGDVLELMEYSGGHYTGAPALKRTVSYVLSSFPGLYTGYVVLGFEPHCVRCGSPTRA